MRKFLSTLLVAGCGAGLLTNLSFAQDRDRQNDNRTTRSRTDFESQSQTSRSRTSREFQQLSSLYGTEIRVRDDDTIGTIDDIFIDDTGRVAFIATEFEGEFLPIPFGAFVLSDLSDGFVFLDLDRDILVGAPRFSTLAELRSRSVLNRTERFFRDDAGIRLRQSSQSNDRIDDQRSRNGLDRDRRNDDRDQFDRDRNRNNDRDRFETDRSRRADDRDRLDSDRNRRNDDRDRSDNDRNRNDRGAGSNNQRDRSFQSDRSYRSPDRDQGTGSGADRSRSSRGTGARDDDQDTMDRGGLVTPGRSPSRGSSSTTAPGSNRSGTGTGTTRGTGGTVPGGTSGSGGTNSSSGSRP